MTIASLGIVMRAFGGVERDPEEQRQLVNEALLMTLARASSSDSHVHPAEVSTVIEIMQEVTGERLSSAEVRVAAHAELFETMSLHSALSKLRHELTSADRVLIAHSLARLIKSDVRISPLETEFFDQVTQALKITPSELAGLV